MKKNHIFSTGSNYGGKYYGRGGPRSAAAKKGWEKRRKNALKANVTTRSREASGQQMHDQLDWIYDQLDKATRKRWETDYEYEDIVDVTLVMAKTDKAFSDKDFESLLDDFRTGKKNINDYL